MRYTAGRDTAMLRRAALGPAAIAQRVQDFRAINRGLPQARYTGNEMMRRGGSYGAMGGRYNSALGCLCGPGDPGFLGTVVASNVVKIGPIAARMIQLRKSGKSAQYALLDAMATLHAQGAKTVTPDIHLQLAAGLQPMPGALNGLLGALGIAPIGGAGMTAASAAGTTVGAGALASGATAVGLATGVGSLGAGIALGQTVIPFPVVGAVIGAIVFEAAHLLKRHVGKAEAAWANQSFYNSLRVMNGRDYDEKQYSEAFKGMMDTNGNVFSQCGPDRHKNPDCFLGPLAGVIAQGYLNRVVPLTATTRDVFNQVVTPWLRSGANGLVNWNVLSREATPTQMLMLQAATDRYLAGQAMTRGDMASYGNQGAHTPTLVQALQPILRQPTTTTPQVGTANVTPQIPNNLYYTQPGVGLPPTYQPGAGLPYGSPSSPPSISSGAITSGGSPSAPMFATGGGGSGGGGGAPSLQPAPGGGGSSAIASSVGSGSANIPWGLLAAAGALLVS